MARSNKNNIKICPRCKGNGYIIIPNKSVDQIGQSITVSCTMCEKQGEIDENKIDSIYVDADGIHRMQ